MLTKVKLNHRWNPPIVIIIDNGNDDDDDEGDESIVDDFLTLLLDDVLLVAGAVERTRVICHDPTAQNPLCLRDWIP